MKILPDSRLAGTIMISVKADVLPPKTPYPQYFPNAVVVTE